MALISAPDLSDTAGESSHHRRPEVPMAIRPARSRRLGVGALTTAILALGLAAPAPALAADAGQIKIARGAAWIERAGTRHPAQVGARVQQSDVVATGPDGSIGIVFDDDSLLSIGPSSTLVIERFAFDPTTQRGSFESTLRSGTLSAVSGRLTRQSPDAMKVRTPAAILGVRGTEFVVRAGAPGN
jgi:hypothetical protein